MTSDPGPAQAAEGRSRGVGVGGPIPAGTVAIDMHVHLRDEVTMQFRAATRASIGKHFNVRDETVSANDLAEIYRSRNMLAVIMNTTDTVATGNKSVPNDHIADVVRDHPDVFIGFGVVDPANGEQAVREALRCQNELGLVGIGELNPARQQFAPNDPQFSPLWGALQQAGMPVLFHGGYAAAGTGTPGGGGVRLSLARPVLLDDVAVDFPHLRIICAHPSWPWTSEALAVTQHKGNVYLDLSGTAPKYFSAELRTYLRRFLSRKALFGTDWPLITPDRWMSEFDEFELDEAVRRRILLDNAAKVLGLGFEADQSAPATMIRERDRS